MIEIEVKCKRLNFENAHNIPRFPWISTILKNLTPDISIDLNLDTNNDVHRRSLEIEEKRNAEEVRKLKNTLSAESELTAAIAVLKGEEREEPGGDKKQELEIEAEGNPKGNGRVRQWLW